MKVSTLGKVPSKLRATIDWTETEGLVVFGWLIPTSFKVQTNPAVVNFTSRGTYYHLCIPDFVYLPTYLPTYQISIYLTYLTYLSYVAMDMIKWKIVTLLLILPISYEITAVQCLSSVLLGLGTVRRNFPR